MQNKNLLLLQTLALGHSAFAAFGPAFSTGPVGNNTFIKSGIATLIVPEGQVPLAGQLSLWVGMGTSNGDLIQTILDRHPGDGVAKTICETSTQPNQWCGYAYTLKESGDQIFGGQVRVVENDHWRSNYTYIPSSATYLQSAFHNGKISSTLSTADGVAQGFGSAVECAATDCGTVPAHQWTNVVITLDGYDANYGNTFGINGATSSGIYTPDGGHTWKIDNVQINQFTFTNS